jgi:hypothetical protein
MSLALKILNGTITQIGSADNLQVNTILRNGAAGTITLGAAADTISIPGNLDVDGTMTVSSTATYEGNVNLGNGGDTINIGSGTDTVNLLDDLAVGANLVSVGSSASDYLSNLWLRDVLNTPTGISLRSTTGAGAGAWAVGVDTTALTVSAPANGALQTVLNALDAAIGGTSETLQEAYDNGETIAVTATDGAVEISTAIAAVNALEVSSSGTGNALVASTSAGGSALQLKDGATTVFDAKGTGEVAITPTSGQNLVATTAGAGKIDLNSTNAVEIDAAANSNFTVTGANLVLSTATSGDVRIQAVTATKIQDGAGTNDVVTVNGAGAFQVTPTSGQNASVTTGGAGTISLTTNGSADLNVNAAGILNLDGASTTLDVTGTFSIDGGAGTSNITQANGALTITAGSASTWSTSSGALSVTSADQLNLTAAATANVVVSTSTTGGIQLTTAPGANVGGAITISSTAGSGGTASDISIESNGASDNAGDVVIGTSATTLVNSGGLVLYAGSPGPAPSPGGINIVAADNLTLSGGTSSGTDITFEANGTGAPIPFNDTTDVDLAPAFNSGSIIGALNELKAGYGATVVEFTTHGGTATAGNVVKITASDTIDDADADDGESATIGILINTATPFKVVTNGLVTGMSGLTAATRYFVSATAGGLTSTAPSTTGQLVRRVGWARTATTFVVQMGEGSVV